MIAPIVIVSCDGVTHRRKAYAILGESHYGGASRERDAANAITMKTKMSNTENL